MRLAGRKIWLMLVLTLGINTPVSAQYQNGYPQAGYPQQPQRPQQARPPQGQAPQYRPPQARPPQARPPQGQAPLARPQQARPTQGRPPQADFPVTLGRPYTVEGKTYTPADNANYDEVGYATVNPRAGSIISAYHKTLPYPSYIEVTSLQSGRTILLRVEGRGPMTNARLVSLSPSALKHIGAREGEPVRVRRVSPPEFEREKLRAGSPAAERAPTPVSLLSILRRKLPEKGSYSIASANARGGVAGQEGVEDWAKSGPSAAAGGAMMANRGTSARAPSRPAAAPASREPSASTGGLVQAPIGEPGYVIQAGTYSSEARANQHAKKFGGYVDKSGKYFRSNVGPFRTRGQADAALAKVRAAGYRDARIYSTK